MAPYRTPSRVKTAPVVDGADERAEEHTLGWLLLVIGGIRTGIAFAEHEVFRAGATIALLMVAIGICMLACRR